jgi:hypothetical protein
MAVKYDAANTNRIAVYPSKELRPPPSFVFDVPEGWQIEESPVALALLRTIDEYDGFWPNVVITYDRVPIKLELREAALATFARFKEQNPGLTVRAEKLGGVAGRPTYIRTLDVTSEGRELSQIHAMFFAPPPDDSRTADLFQIVGTCPTALIDAVGVRVLEVITSFRFT